jgi:mannosyltransferase
MPDENPGLSGRLRAVAGFAIAVIVVAGVILRFYTHSALWLDEALTVDISRLPLASIPGALKRDGAPPLFYFLLHFWMGIFGDSDLATRSLSGVIGVATLPVAWLAGNRLGGRLVGGTAVVLLASAPFAVYYSTEARMYALIILLTGLGFLALSRALAAPRRGNLIAIAVVTAALLYTQYWSLYLVATVAIWLLLSAWTSRRKAPESPDWKRPLHAVVAMGAGGLLFVPWLPTFVYQSRHTGTPWASPANFAAVIHAVTGFADNQASASTVGTDQGRLLAVIYIALAVLALFGVARNERIIDLDLQTRPPARGLSFVVLGTLFLAIAFGLISASAFSSRYAAVVFLPLILLVAYGTRTLLSTRLRTAVVAVAVVAGFIGSFQNIDAQRTQAPQVATVLNAQAKRGDIVAFCPDQLGPDVYRVIDHPSRYDMLTFPRQTGPQFVNWVDYKQAIDAAHPKSFAAELYARAGTTHRVWMVWQPGYQAYGIKCENIVRDLVANAKFTTRIWVVNHGVRYYEPMNLTEFAPAGT